MADRRSSAVRGSDPASVLADILDVVSGLEQRVASQEALLGLMLPGDYRFDADPDGAVVVVRVSTGNRARITGPL